MARSPTITRGADSLEAVRAPAGELMGALSTFVAQDESNAASSKIGGRIVEVDAIVPVLDRAGEHMSHSASDFR